MGFSKIILMLSLLTAQFSFAVPIDWNGSLGIDTNIIKDVRRTGEACPATVDGSECIKSDEDNARFQSMVLRLNPKMIVNDGITIKGEISTGSVRGNNMGDSTEWDNAQGGSYFAQTTSSTLNINQIYAELYADTALFKVGRFAKNYGLGAVLNSGDSTFDHFFSGYEGIEAQLKLGNFHLTPMWAKIASNPNLPNGGYDTYEASVMAMYDNSNKNMKVGVYYGAREVETNSDLYGAGKGPHNVNIIDIFFEKKWEKFEIAMEIPMLSGDVGTTYNTASSENIDANAYLLETKYQLNSKWLMGLNAGMVKGDDGSSNKFEGMYLHPNYQIAEIMYKYNYNGFNDSNYNIYNSSIVNSTYAQFYAHYSTSEWTWKFSALWAKANEVASNGNDFYDHSKKALVKGLADQSDDLGYELDIAFDYLWNPAVKVTGFLGYHFVGDFYAFKNDPTNEIGTTNVMATGVKLSVNF